MLTLYSSSYYKFALTNLCICYCPPSLLTTDLFFFKKKEALIFLAGVGLSCGMWDIVP